MTNLFAQIFEIRPCVILRGQTQFVQVNIPSGHLRRVNFKDFFSSLSNIENIL